MDGGADVIDIGMVGTEEVYFATRFYGVDGGIQVTASHNPIDYNGMKLVKKDAQPISGDNGLYEIQRLAQDNHFAPPGVRGQLETQLVREHYVEHLLSYIDLNALLPMKIVVNAGNGAAGPTLDALELRWQNVRCQSVLLKSTISQIVVFLTGSQTRCCQRISGQLGRQFVSIRQI